MQLCLIVDQESLFLSPRLIWITVNGHVYRCARINFTNPMLKRSFNRPFKLVSMQVYSIQTLTFRYKVISLQLDSILIKVVSRNHRSRFDTCRKSIRFNSSSGPQQVERQGARAPLEIFRFELNSLQKWKFAYQNRQLSMEATVSKYCRSLQDYVLLFLCAIWNCVKERNRIFALPKTTTNLQMTAYFSSKIDQNAPMTIPELGFLDFFGF